jgi:hypothetical protein
LAFVERFASGENVLIRERLLYVYVWLHYIFSVINCLIFIALCIIIIYCLFLVHCVFFVVIWIFGVLTPLSVIFQLYHGDQFTKPGANPRHIGDRLVWAVRSNDLTHWTTWDVFVWLHCVLLYIVYSWLHVHCVFFVVIWIFGVLCHFQQYHGDQFTKPGANPRYIGDRFVWAVRSNDLTHWTTRDLFFCCMFLLDYIVYYYYILFILDYRYIVYFFVVIWIFGVLCHFQQYFSYIMVTNLQCRARIHAVLVIGLYELLDPTT